MITLAVGATSVTLPRDLYWDDEFSYAPVEQAVARTITGALVVQVATRVGGRPITLRPFEEGCAWMARSVLEQLRVWAASPGQQMTLTLRGVARTVVFRHHDQAIDATQVSHWNDAVADDDFNVTVRFMESA